MRPACPQLKDALDKFEKDFQAEIYLKVNPLLQLLSGTNWVSPVLRTKMQELIMNTDFAKKSVSPQNPLGTLWARV